MRKFTINMSLFSLLVVLVASVFPPAAVLIPVCALVLGLLLVGGFFFFIFGLLGQLATPRNR